MLKGVPGLEPSEADKMDWVLYEKTVNTPERMKSYLQYNLLQAGGKDGQLNKSRHLIRQPRAFSHKI